MRNRLVVIVVAVCWILAPRPAVAWGFDAHKYIMARVIPLLPAEIRPFFRKYDTTVVEHVIDPDLWRTAGWEEESPRHFLDMDAYGPYPFTELPHEYDQAVGRYGRDFVLKNGLLPWRSAEMYGKLVEAFTQKTPFARENIKFFSSVLTHYISDAHVPFHAVLNHDGQLTGQLGIHARFESDLFDRNRARLRVNPKPIVTAGPVREFVFETLKASFSLAQPILDADKEAVDGRDMYDDQYFTIFFSKAQPILERRLAESITSSASLIAAAWIEAGRPAVPLAVPRTLRQVRRTQ
jgi:hypothetical protein